MTNADENENDKKGNVAIDIFKLARLKIREMLGDPDRLLRFEKRWFVKVITSGRVMSESEAMNVLRIYKDKYILNRLDK